MITAILRDGDRITIQKPGKLQAQVLRLYRNGVIAGYILAQPLPPTLYDRATANINGG